MPDILILHFPNAAYVLLSLSGLSLIAVYLLRWRYYTLARKYADWQAEAQDVEVATHVALYNQKDADVPVYPNISVVVTTRNQEVQLEQLLLKLLQQEYAGCYEVIVADQKSRDDTQDVVKRLQERFSNLRHTYVPQTSRFIELRKLALTLGIKASYSEWIIVVNPETIPVTNRWLQHFSENLLPGIDFVEAYYNYEDDGSFVARRSILERVRRFCRRLHAFENNCVLGCETANFAVRKSWFMDRKGFIDSLCLPFGEESIFAYRHAETDRTAFLCALDTKLVEELPTSVELRERRICEAEVCRVLKGFAQKYTRRESMASLFLYLALMANMIYSIVRVWHDAESEVYSLQFVYTDVLSLLCWVLMFVLPAVLLKRSTDALGEMPFGIFVLLHELCQPWRNMSIDLGRRLRRADFKRKYLG